MCSLGFLVHLSQKSGTGAVTLYPLGSELELGHQNMSSLALSYRGRPGQCCSSRQLSIFFEQSQLAHRAGGLGCGLTRLAPASH